MKKIIGFVSLLTIFYAMQSYNSIMPIKHFDEIVIMKYPAQSGGSPGYKLTIQGDGQLDYEGYDCVETIGKTKKFLSHQETSQLIDAINQANYISLSKINFNNTQCMDALSTHICVKMKCPACLFSKNYCIVDYCSEGFEKKPILTKFINEIDRIADSEQWTWVKRTGRDKFHPNCRRSLRTH